MIDLPSYCLSNINFLQVSYGAKDPSLTNRERYPFFYRTIPSEDLINTGRLQLLQTLGWFRIGMFSSTDHVYAKV